MPFSKFLAYMDPLAFTDTYEEDVWALCLRLLS